MRLRLVSAEDGDAAVDDDAEDDDAEADLADSAELKLSARPRP